MTASRPRSPALVGGTPSTTYAENIGVMAVTKVYATQLFWYAGAFAFVIGGFVPKFGAVDQLDSRRRSWAASRCCCSASSHSSGLRLLVKSGIDYSHSRNLIMSSVVLVIGIGMETGGFTIPLGKYTIPGMALATLVGIILNLILPTESKGLAEEPVAEFMSAGPPRPRRTQPRRTRRSSGLTPRVRPRGVRRRLTRRPRAAHDAVRGRSLLVRCTLRGARCHAHRIRRRGMASAPVAPRLYAR